MSPAPAPDRCPHCRAPRDLAGNFEHGRFCPKALDWRRTRREYPDLGDPPRTEVSELSADEARDELLRIALAIEDGWSRV